MVKVLLLSQARLANLDTVADEVAKLAAFLEVDSYDSPAVVEMVYGMAVPLLGNVSYMNPIDADFMMYPVKNAWPYGINYTTNLALAFGYKILSKFLWTRNLTLNFQSILPSEFAKEYTTKIRLKH